MDYSKWKTAQEDILEISEMTTLHIENCINAIEKQTFPDMPYETFEPYIEVFNAELDRRKVEEVWIEYLRIKCKNGDARLFQIENKLNEIIGTLNKIRRI